MRNSVTLSWSIPQAPLEWAERPDDASEWDLNPSHLWGGLASTEPESSNGVAGAIASLRGLLADGPQPVRVIKRAADQRGISKKTLDRAKKKLGVVSKRESTRGRERGSGRWLWRLEEKAVPSNNLQDSHNGDDGAIEPSEQRRLNEVGPPLPEYYPRLVGRLERGVNYDFVAEPARAFEVIAQLVPGAFKGTVRLTGEELDRGLRGESDNAPPLEINIKRKPIKDAAEKYGLLAHPRFGDSLFGWALTALEIQLILALWAAAQAPLNPGDPDNYPRAVERILARRESASVRLDGKTHSLFCVPLPVPLFVLERYAYDPGERMHRTPEGRYAYEPGKGMHKNPKGLIPAGKLKRRLLGALQERLNQTLAGLGQSQVYIYFDHSPEARKLQAGENLGDDEELPSLYQGEMRSATLREALLGMGSPTEPEADAVPYVGVKAGLYTCALWQLLEELSRSPQLRTCQGCGRLFVPTWPTQKYCPSSKDACKQGAYRMRRQQTGAPG